MPIALWLLAVALLLTGTGLWLWQRAQQRSQQDVSAAFVNRQIEGMQATQMQPQDGGERPPQLQLQIEALRHFFLRAGIEHPSSRLYVQLLVPAIGLPLLALILGGWLSALGTLMLYAMVLVFYFWLRSSKLQRTMVRQLPGFLDTLVRLVTIGNSIGAAFQTGIAGAEGPLRVVLDRANRQVQAGVDLEHALRHQAGIFRFKELDLVAAVIGVSSRFGGRSDLVLERMAAFMRDLEHAQNELVALSAEIRLSAWIMGLLPVAIGMFLIIFNNNMFVNMWHDPIGKKMLIGALVLELLGGYGLFRLAKSV
ncbi:type II secretion system (T2SS), F family protein [Collimonas fungivorans]|uniref:Type II secretion system (T2SS), F family protein n=1 Tax=Collimonas fungivorans TaxID=158899 RepID=A0A127P855_9BURK|nr:type II secretion system F family protein [Collimonas fungivorans]AMO93845.1 type II secretion system (T2SS), F family protein [Collimonas fungivorans]